MTPNFAFCTQARIYSNRTTRTGHSESSILAPQRRFSKSTTSTQHPQSSTLHPGPHRCQKYNQTVWNAMSFAPRHVHIYLDRPSPPPIFAPTMPPSYDRLHTTHSLTYRHPISRTFTLPCAPELHITRPIPCLPIRLPLSRPPKSKLLNLQLKVSWPSGFPSFP